MSCNFSFLVLGDFSGLEVDGYRLTGIGDRCMFNACHLFMNHTLSKICVYMIPNRSQIRSGKRMQWDVGNRMNYPIVEEEKWSMT